MDGKNGHKKSESLAVQRLQGIPIGGPQDGESDHTGIVERVEDGIVYTVEGNSGDSCRENHYAVGYYEILGYGIPAY